MEKITFWYNCALTFKSLTLSIKILSILSFMTLLYCGIVFIKAYHHNFIINTNIIFQPESTNTFTPFGYLHKNQITPIVEAILIEVVNKRNVQSKIRSYNVEMKIKGKWVELLPIFTYDDGMFCTFSDKQINIISFGDIFVMQNFTKEMPVVPANDALKIWTFFTMPDEYKKVDYPLGKLRITIENAFGEKQTAYLKAKNNKNKNKGVQFDSAFPIKIEKNLNKNIKNFKFNF